MNNVQRAWLLLAFCMLLTGCPAGGQHGAQHGAGGKNAAQQPPQPWLSVCLVRSDLGLADGCYVREADAVLAEYAKQGVIAYSTVGDLPLPLTQEGSAGEIGLPESGAGQPGSMTLIQANELLDTAPKCDLLILGSPYLLPSACKRISAGKLQAGAVLLLDDIGWQEQKAPPVPVYHFSYEIDEVAFMCGVAAAASSNTGKFVILATNVDPEANNFLNAARAGAFFITNGAQVRGSIVPADADGVIAPENFSAGFSSLMQNAGPAFDKACNHYIIDLGRATPTVMYALTQNPRNGFVAGAFADFRQVRPARVIGCAIKHPGEMLKRLFSMPAPGVKATTPALTQGLAGLKTALPSGRLRLGLADGVVGMAGYDMYKRYNSDGDDIEGAVTTYLGQILKGELSVPDTIKQYSK
jgi:basic membrane lipoprotein Med (substrate-binding protein (PBP1-ABC) superfamily)